MKRNHSSLVIATGLLALLGLAFVAWNSGMVLVASGPWFQEVGLVGGAQREAEARLLSRCSQPSKEFLEDKSCIECHDRTEFVPLRW